MTEDDDVDALDLLWPGIARLGWRVDELRLGMDAERVYAAARLMPPRSTAPTLGLRAIAAEHQALNDGATDDDGWAIEVTDSAVLVLGEGRDASVAVVDGVLWCAFAAARGREVESDFFEARALVDHGAIRGEVLLPDAGGIAALAAAVIDRIDEVSLLATVPYDPAVHLFAGEQRRARQRVAAMFTEAREPTADDVAAALGERRAYYDACLAALAQASLSPSLRWFGPTSGWAPVCERDGVVVCGFALADRPLAGLMGISEAVAKRLRADRALPAEALALVDAVAPVRVENAGGRREDFRWLDIDLAGSADVERFVALIEAKLRALAAV